MTDGLKKPVRVRIAPSPTGPLHLGTARTALFNWLFAKKNNGVFIVRIEDTDLERSDPKYEKDILNGLRWLNLTWNEEIIRQSERLNIYEKYINALFHKGLVYYCFCTKEQLEEERQAMLAQGIAPKYSGRCRHLSDEDASKRLKNGDSSIIRFKIPEKEISFTDVIRGKITFNGSLIGDIAIAKDKRTPLYNFAVVIDDHEMKISHVIRGEDHIANTPKQIFLQEALGFERPHYAHLPLILSPDRSKLSKRYLETSIGDYKKDGYLPEAIINFMALLGWHSKTDKEVFTKEELIGEFDLKRVQKQGAVFNIEKLDWINAQYIKTLASNELALRLKDFVPSKWNGKMLASAAEIEKERIKKLTDFKELADFFFELKDYDKELLIWKNTPENKILENLRAIQKLLLSGVDEAEIMKIAEERGRGETLWPLRAALSGKPESPGPFDIIKVLGYKETLRRVEIAIKKLEK